MTDMKKCVFTIILLCSISITGGQTPEMILFRSEAFIINSEFDKAIDECTKGVADFNDYRIYLKRGNAYLKVGRIEQAHGDFIQANRLMMNSGDLGLARIAAGTGNMEEAITILERLMSSEFKVGEKELMLDPYFQLIEDSPEWRSFLKREWYNDLEQGIQVIEYQVKEGRLSEAREVYSSLAPVYSEKPEVNYLSGIIALHEGDYRTASKDLQQAISDGYGTYNAYTSYIIVLQSDKSYSASLPVIAEALRTFPDRKELYLYRVEALRNSGDRDGALEELAYILEAYPGNIELVGMAGRIASEDKKYTTALKYYNQNIQNNPGDPDSYLARAGVYLKTKNWEYAVEDYSMALDLDPYNPDTYYSKGLALIEERKMEDACHDLRRALKLGNRKAASLISRYCIR